MSAAHVNSSGQVVFAVTDAQQKRSFVEYLGTVMQVGSHPVSTHLARFPTGLNSRSQVALRAQLSTGSDAIFLLTPP